MLHNMHADLQVIEENMGNVVHIDGVLHRVDDLIYLRGVPRVKGVRMGGGGRSG